MYSNENEEATDNSNNDKPSNFCIALSDIWKKARYVLIAIAFIARTVVITYTAFRGYYYLSPDETILNTPFSLSIFGVLFEQLIALVFVLYCFYWWFSDSPKLIKDDKAIMLWIIIGLAIPLALLRFPALI